MNVQSTVIRTIATNCPKLKSFAFTWHSDLNGSKCEYEHLSFCQQIDELEVTSARSMDYLGTEILFSYLLDIVNVIHNMLCMQDSQKFQNCII